MVPKRGRAALNPKLISLAVASCFAAGAAFANPVGPTVVNGQVTVKHAGNLLQITNSPNAIINWQSFSIGASEITRFIQQGNSSSVLNRVTGSAGMIDPSIILGSLQSNGRVFLINPSGIVFGAGAQVDVAGLVASSLNLSNADFLAGRMRFTEVAGAGAITNRGDIHTAPGGEVYLVGPAVTNKGIITSPQGEVVLAAGNRVELVNPGTPNLRVEVAAAENQARNLGRIVADAGRVGIYAGIINHSGTIRADSAQVTEDGRIVLKATKNTTLEAGSVTTANGPNGGRIEIQSGDTTIVAGTVEAKGSEGKGGTVHVLGDKVGLVGEARIDASGRTGGGTVLVGGDFQGRNPAIQNASATVMGSEASIAADAIARGNGGKVIVWSDEMTRAYGKISARGGKKGGDGGLVEVSSKGWLDFHSDVDTSAPKGNTGTLLLDPTNVEIVATCCGGEGHDGSFSFASSSGDPSIFTPGHRPQGDNTPSQVTWSDIIARLANNHIIITTSDNDGDPGQAGNITVVAASGNFNRSNYLQLVAHNNVDVNASINNTGSGEIRMYSGWNGVDAIHPAVGNNGAINLNSPVSTGGNMILEAGGSINQIAAAPVSAAALWARARANVNMDLAPNEVGTLAGRAGEDFRNGAAFRFRNAQSLVIGSTAMGTGIVVDGGEGNAVLDVNVTSGSLTANQFVRASSPLGTATVTLAAANQLTIQSDEVEALGGSDGAGRAATVNLRAGAGGIRIDGAEGIRAQAGNVSGQANGAGGVATINMTTTNGGTILVRATEVVAEGGYGHNGDGGAAAINLTSAGGITADQSARFMATAGAAGTNGSGGSGAGGAASITFSAGGAISLNGAGVVQALGGGTDSSTASHSAGNASVSFTATGSIQVQGGNGIFASGGISTGAGGGGAATIDLSSDGGIEADQNAQFLATAGAAAGGSGAGGAASITFGTGGAISLSSGVVQAIGGGTDSSTASHSAGNATVSFTATGSIQLGAGNGIFASAGNSSGAGGGGDALIVLDTGGALTLNAAGLIAQGGASFPDTSVANKRHLAPSAAAGNGGNARITLASNGSMTIGNGAQVIARGGLSVTGTGGEGAVEMAGGSITVNGLSRVVGDGGEGQTRGGKGVLDILAEGNLTVSGAEGAGAFGGNGANGGGDAETTLTSANGSIFIDEMRRAVGSNNGNGTGKGIFAHGGAGSASGSTGGIGSLLVATDGSGNISSNVSHLDAVGGTAAGTGGMAEVALLAKGGNISITNGYDGEFFPGAPAPVLGGTVGAMGGSGVAAGGAATTSLLASGTITIDNDVVGSIGGNAQSGTGGDATLAVGGAGGITIVASNVGALGGNGASGGGNATAGFESAGNIRIQGPSPVLGGNIAHGAIGGSSDTGNGGHAELVFKSLEGDITVFRDGIGSVGGGSVGGGSGGAGNLIIDASEGSIFLHESHVIVSGGAGSVGGAATASLRARQSIEVIGAASQGATTPTNSLIVNGGSGSSGKGGDADLLLKSLEGDITVFRDEIASFGGSAGGAGGSGILTIDASEGSIFLHESHVTVSGGAGSVGGAATANLRARHSIEVIGAATQGGTTPTTSLIASGGSAPTAEGLGRAEIFMVVLSPTGEIVIRNDVVHAQGGQLTESNVFGPATITLDFRRRTSGGFSVDDQPGAITGDLPPGCTAISSECLPRGFVVNQGNEPTVLDTNFFVTYGGTTDPVVPPDPGLPGLPNVPVEPRQDRFSSPIIDAMERIFETGSNLIQRSLAEKKGDEKKDQAVCN